MDYEIRPFGPDDIEGVVALSLRAWAPVFVGICDAFGPELSPILVPDWRPTQEAAVRAVCADEQMHVWVADASGAVVGFVAVRLHDDGDIGEIYMIAVDPDAQGHGIGVALNQHSFAWIKAQGFPVAMVETGGDEGHAGARRTYERSGMHLVPVARYFKKL